MEEEMDSLFEGMVLFTPSHQQVDLDQESKPEPEPEPEPDQPSPSPPSPLPPRQSSSEPLDENLFSDLTLVTAPPEPPASSSSSPVVSRQLSTTRKKKRAAGLRIGYARQSSSTVDNSDRDSPVVNGVAADEDEVDDEDSSRRNSLSSEKVQVVQPQESTTTTTATATATATAIATTTTTSTDVIEDQRTSLTREGDDQDNDAAPSNQQHQVEQRFEQIKKNVSQRLKSAQQAVESVSAARKDSIRRRRKASDSLSQASAKYRDLEKELERACEAEDFEEADRVSQSLSSAEKEREVLLASLREAEAECDALDSKMQEVLEAQIQAEEECASLLNSFSVDAVGNADLILKNAEAVFSKEMEDWLSSNEALEVKRMELEIESYLMQETRMVLTDSIEHSVEDDRRERDLLYKKKEFLAEELEKLLALVKEKEADIAENNSNIDKVEKRIAGVVSTFQGGQSSIDSKYNDLQSGLSEIELENKSLTKRKEEIDAFLSLEEARGAKIRELSRISTDEASKYLEDVGLRRSLLQFILRYEEDKVRLAKTEEKLSEDVERLKQEISTARASLQELSSKKSSIQQETESNRQRLIFIDKRAPELEAEKKVAATARNFKEAARIAAEAKVLSIEREELHAKIEEMLLEVKRLEEEILSTLDIVQETEGQMLSKEKELAMARFQRLTMISSAAAAERSAALELGDLEEAEILQAEAEFASAEARRLEPINDIKEEAVASLPKYFVSMELVSKFRGKRLEDLAASAHILKS